MLGFRFGLTCRSFLHRFFGGRCLLLLFSILASSLFLCLLLFFGATLGFFFSSLLLLLFALALRLLLGFFLLGRLLGLFFGLLLRFALCCLLLFLGLFLCFSFGSLLLLFGLALRLRFRSSFLLFRLTLGFFLSGFLLLFFRLTTVFFVGSALLLLSPARFFLCRLLLFLSLALLQQLLVGWLVPILLRQQDWSRQRICEHGLRENGGRQNRHRNRGKKLRTNRHISFSFWKAELVCVCPWIRRQGRRTSPAVPTELGQIPATSQIRYRNPHERRLNSTVPELRDFSHSFSQKFYTFRDAVEWN